MRAQCTERADHPVKSTVERYQTAAPGRMRTPVATASAPAIAKSRKPAIEREARALQPLPTMRRFTALLFPAVCLALAACNGKSGAQNVDDATDRAEKAVDDAAKKAEQSLDRSTAEAKTRADAAQRKLEPKIDAAGEKIGNAAERGANKTADGLDRAGEKIDAAAQKAADELRGREPEPKQGPVAVDGER